MARTSIIAALVLIACAIATPASADLPNTATLLADLGYAPDQITKVRAGDFVRGTIQPSGPRELVAAFAFQMPTSPAGLVAEAKKGLLDKVDRATSRSVSCRGLAARPTSRSSPSAQMQ